MYVVNILRGGRLGRAPTEPAQVCEAGKPLTFRDVTVYRIDNSGSFNLKSWRGEKGTAYLLNVEEGVVKSTQARGAIY